LFLGEWSTHPLTIFSGANTVYKQIYLLLLLLIPYHADAEVVLCTGMSNAREICDGWINANSTNHQIVNGAQGGFDIESIYTRPEEYWSGVMAALASQGLSPEQVQVIWNLNATRSRSGDLITERQIVHDYFIWFQASAEAMFPNLRAGYHSPRTSGEFCLGFNPEPFAGDVINAIVGIGDSSGAVTHFDKWSLGPDLSAPKYVETDFSDGCHPGGAGLAKTTPIMNAFFNAKNEPPPKPSSEPVVEYKGRGEFKIVWAGKASILSCSGVNFNVVGNSHSLKVPSDLPFGAVHFCRLDGGRSSQGFG
jgi:hypothetical protein